MRKKFRVTSYEEMVCRTEATLFGTTNVTTTQQQKLAELQDELLAQRGVSTRLPLVGEGDGYVFTEIGGVTVTIGPRGRYDIPAVRSFSEHGTPGEIARDAVLYADELWERQKSGIYKTGHFSPIIDTDWKCGDDTCSCQAETLKQRRRRSRSH